MSFLYSHCRIRCQTEVLFRFRAADACQDVLDPEHPLLVEAQKTGMDNRSIFCLCFHRHPAVLLFPVQQVGVRTLSP